ncbi:MAG: isoprenylcysteine carboxylmethyltransferase family protein [Candidatus Omnitrophica bacterium]|nr:isoprenylcysteine carboxylmethyltransferase family protein [Candidatus Omnitrophota bacterium]
MSLFDKLRKPRFLFVYPMVPLLFLLASTTERQLRLGLAIVLLGEGLRLWANGYVGHVKVNVTQKRLGEAKIGRLITAGPYAFVRHPLYLGTFLIGTGFCVVVGNVWFGIAALAFFLIVYRRKMAQEEALIHEEWGAAYEAYHAAVPRWLPTWRRYSMREGRWSWQGVSASKEFKTLSWIIVLLLLLYFRMEWIQEGESFLAKHWLKSVCLLGLLVVLVLLDGCVGLIRWRAKFMTRTAAPR